MQRTTLPQSHQSSTSTWWAAPDTWDVFRAGGGQGEHRDLLWSVVVTHLPGKNREASQHQYSENHSLLSEACRHHAESLCARVTQPRVPTALDEGSAALRARPLVFCGFSNRLKPVRKRFLSFLHSDCSIPLNWFLPFSQLWESALSAPFCHFLFVHCPTVTQGGFHADVNGEVF